MYYHYADICGYIYKLGNMEDNMRQITIDRTNK